MKKRTIKIRSKFSIPLGEKNFKVFGIGIIVLVLGFYVMTFKPWDSIFALVISPIILLFGYFVVFPFGILKKFKNDK